MVQILPQESSLAELLGTGVGAGVGGGVSAGLQQKLQLMAGQPAARAKEQEQEQKQLRALILAKAGGLDPSEVVGLEVGEVSQLIRSKAEEKKALARSEELQRAEKVKISSQRSGKVLDRADELREGLPAKENALRFMKDAIEEGDIGFFSGNNLAELTGVEAFRTAKGAQLITAGKEFFLGSIRRAGPRPNIFIEQQIAKMMPKIGRNKEANLTAAALLGADLDVETERVRITDELEQESLDRQGFVPGNLGALVTERLKPIAQERQDALAKELHEIQKGPQATKFKETQPGAFPKAVDFPNKRIRDNSTGKVFMSDGKTWKLVK